MVSVSDNHIEDHSYTLNWTVHMCFNSKLYSDVTIHLGDIELPAHSIVLASQSEYFKKALESPMKEGIERKFEFSEGSMHAHWRVFEYIYRGEYILDAAVPLGSIGQHLSTIAPFTTFVLPTYRTDSRSLADDEDLLKDIRVYELADYFQIENLKQYAFLNFKARLKTLWVSDNIIDCIREVYKLPSNLSYGMRIEIAKLARKHLVDLWDKKTFRNLIREGGQFVIDIMKDIIAEK
ncbi:hypothetical protein THAR02_02764 [Trichoderma harzianum]|uniref:BTB domain-containing protein n=1 Tax=Trichoderma harzianum TaxID=5544 RepID=A0A0G0AK18_TRIHA|nr:hypothetical protein THAR02_02764 [Trichoderma harzianum]